MPKLLDIPEVLMPSPECGKAAVRAVLQYLGLPVIVSERIPVDYVNGTSPLAVIEAFRVAGVSRVLVGEIGINVLESLWKQGWPVICPIQMPNYEDGHWVVVRGINHGRVHYHCPIQGRSSLQIDEWIERWRDTDASGKVYTEYGIAVATD